MLHIATHTSSWMQEYCRYKQRAGFVRSYYTVPMGLRIKSLREARGWTQDDLAERANVSRSQLAQIESEARPANTLRLNAIASALGVETWLLFSVPDVDERILKVLPDLNEDDRSTIIRLAEALAQQNISAK